jgi:ribosomal protein L31
MEEQTVKKLMTSMKCTSCGHNYQMNDVKVLGNHQDLYFLQVNCSSCHSQFLITATINNNEDTEIISDLTDAEFTKFQNSRTPSANDVLDMHSFLKEFDGDFSGIFGYRKV